jgi:hypothetical protein
LYYYFIIIYLLFFAFGLCNRTGLTSPKGGEKGGAGKERERKEGYKKRK